MNQWDVLAVVVVGMMVAGVNLIWSCSDSYRSYLLKKQERKFEHEIEMEELRHNAWLERWGRRSDQEEETGNPEVTSDE